MGRRFIMIKKPLPEKMSKDCALESRYNFHKKPPTNEDVLFAQKRENLLKLLNQRDMQVDDIKAKIQKELDDLEKGKKTDQLKKMVPMLPPLQKMKNAVEPMGSNFK